ncbi:MAG: hypothetical protein V4539_04715 [Bacteroidota bacterium]
MNNITTYDELMQEKRRLKLMLEERKILVQTEFEEIKVKLKPLTHIVEMVEKVTTKDKSNPLLNIGIDMGVNLLLKNVLLRNAGFIVKLLVPLMAKNFLSHEAEETGNILSKVTRFVKKQFKQHQPA